MKKRVIAINLPQFHPFKENDEWWGKGFTEWTNVTKACPRFKGHYQPHLPSDTGFYDLRLPEARQMQADMAREAGIYGFCYYHYWFNGKQLMERPINDILKSGEPDFPFMLCWANENWARNWDGGFKDVLIEQKYSREDDIEHIRWLCKNVFSDKRYIRVNDKPVFSIYRKSLFPNISETLLLWRRIAREEFGMELYLMFADYHADKYRDDPEPLGFDASFDFPPIDAIQFIRPQRTLLYKILNRLPLIKRWGLINHYILNQPEFFSYRKYVNSHIKTSFPKIKCYPCVSPGFDNSPRRVGKPFLCFYDSTPELYGCWLSHTMKSFIPFSDEENFIFINAWNEWAEGNHLEPDQKWGRQYLEETRKAIMNNVQ